MTMGENRMIVGGGLPASGERAGLRLDRVTRRGSYNVGC